MAGIGFRIGHLLRSDDLSSKLGGVIASIILSCGPWLCTILSIGLLSALIPPEQDPMDRALFRVIINYTYLASLIGFSVIEMTTTRYLADALYLKQERVIPTLFAQMSAVILLLSSCIGYLFYYTTDLPWQVTVVAVACLAVVTAIWFAMIFLSACKDYVHITLSFFIGTLVCVFTVLVFTRLVKTGLLGLCLGFTLGQIATFVLLAARIFKEFGVGFLAPRDFFSHCAKNRILIGVGFFYALAVWVDKLVFWFVPQTSEKVATTFFKSSAYDAGLFLAYLFVVPSMAYFLVKVETEFYTVYRRYFSLIDQAPLTFIEDARREIIKTIRSNMGGLALFQGFFTVGALIFAPHIVESAGLPLLYITVFRYGLFACTLHTFALFTNILILYFDLPKIVAWNYALFAFLNGSLAYLSTQLDYRYHGIGYALSSLTVLVISLLGLRRVLRDLEFHIFMKQPLNKPSALPLILEKVSLKD